ncbi:hypothetical protein HDA32_000749 [Spinactinospora alkalitolerans]|uniref:DUF8129 domain-containing protein n=1 Tax=Spinactinospora alkalitolerans TaxID=687207 RepID=A0A852TNS6_9ACTN|nr:hypothetical protein [Spinactinospora alkalitolerans]NYE45629.1 hypothetical protein [Spinactinospora alkalitolerans]
MSKPSIASRISDAVKRVFGKATRPVVSSKPGDMAAGDAPVNDPVESKEPIPADTSAGSMPEEYTDEAPNTDAPAVTEEPVGEKPEPLAEKEPEPAEPAAETDAAGTKPAKAAGSAPAAKAKTAKTTKAAKAKGKGGKAAGSAAGSGGGKAKSDLVKPEEKAEIAAALDDADTKTVAADSSVFDEALAADAAKSGDPAELPVPNYETLSLPSIRARLRKLTVDQVRQLRAHETATTNRTEFVRMYDNRIAKLEAEDAQ